MKSHLNINCVQLVVLIGGTKQALKAAPRKKKKKKKKKGNRDGKFKWVRRQSLRSRWSRRGHAHDNSNTP